MTQKFALIVSVFLTHFPGAARSGNYNFDGGLPSWALWSPSWCNGPWQFIGPIQIKRLGNQFNYDFEHSFFKPPSEARLIRRTYQFPKVLYESTTLANSLFHENTCLLNVIPYFVTQPSFGLTNIHSTHPSVPFYKTNGLRPLCFFKKKRRKKRSILSCNLIGQLPFVS